jgi:hypothetical protein
MMTELPPLDSAHLPPGIRALRQPQAERLSLSAPKPAEQPTQPQSLWRWLRTRAG